jgi:hypothetical protein
MRADCNLRREPEQGTQRGHSPGRPSRVAQRDDAALLGAVTPIVAVIPVGPQTFGRASNSAFTPFAYGHPRADVVTLLSGSIVRHRTPAKTVMVAEHSRTLHKVTVGKRFMRRAGMGRCGWSPGRRERTPPGTSKAHASDWWWLDGAGHSPLACAPPYWCPCVKLISDRNLLKRSCRP